MILARIIGLGLVSLFAAVAQAATHPLDSLTTSEYQSVVSILNADGKVTESTRFPQIALLPPDKAFVKAWTAGEDFPRTAVVYIKEGLLPYKAEVDLVAETVLSYEEADGEGMILLEEIFGATDLALSSAEMVDGLALRGLTPDEVYCLPLTAGTYGDPMEKGKRLMKVPCYKLPDENNWYSQPIEGLFAFVDMSASEVLEVFDQGVMPVPEKNWGYAVTDVEANYGSFRGVVPEVNDPNIAVSKEAVPPEDMPYTIDGSVVKWDIWRFQFRADKRPGMILSNIEVWDEDVYRSVLYEAHLSEVFVPYMDPDEAWYWRTYMDSGEYGFGVFMSPLTPGVDCPADATYMPVTFNDDLGMPFQIPDSVCMFERMTGDPSWRHFEIMEPEKPAEGRPAKELVFRYASEVGNYDYLVDYIFMEDGTIRVAVGSTGLDATKGVTSTSMTDAGAADETRYGSLIAPNLVGVYHSHFFNFRLDFDVDGDANEFTKANLAPLDTSMFDVPRTSMWGVQYETVTTELEARTKINPMAPSNWYFSNPNTQSALGHNPAYELIPGGSYAHSLMALGDMPIDRNAYIENQLYVTPYDPTEIYAGGEYAVHSDGNETLQTWTELNRPIGNQDIVAWYTVGFHHVPRMEDWPIMPTHWAFFKIRPFNFFDHNPAMTVAPPGMSTSASSSTEEEDDEQPKEALGDDGDSAAFSLGALGSMTSLVVLVIAGLSI